MPVLVCIQKEISLSIKIMHTLEYVYGKGKYKV